MFPSVEIPEHDYGDLQTEIENVILAHGLQVVPAQVKKVIQLYETMLVRHGVMLVGPTGSGKTSVYKVKVTALMSRYGVLKCYDTKGTLCSLFILKI